MTVVRKIILGYASVVVLALAMVVVGVFQIRALQSGYDRYVTSTRVQVSGSNQIAIGASSVSGYVLAAVATKDTVLRSQFIDQLKAEEDTTKQALDQLASLESGTDTAATGDLRVQVDQFDSAVTSALGMVDASQAIAQNQVLSTVLPLAQRLAESADQYQADQQAQADIELDHLRGVMTRLFILMIGMTALIVVAAIVLGALVTTSIGRQLRAAVTSIDSSATEMLAIASQVAAGATQTAAATHQTTATVEEVKQTALLANEKASQVAENSQNVAQIAEQGRAAVEDTIVGIEKIQSQMAMVAETIGLLSDQTQAVGEIITTVSDLAEQSNLLSVNASIEAAKAGDHGKGFTVVAQEVKSLAEQSKQAVTQIRTILGEIQKAGKLAVQAAEQSREAIEAGRQQSLESGEAIQMLADSVNEAVQSAVQIAASSRQQLAGMEQISQAIEAINQAGSQSATGTRQVESEVRQLQDLALRIRRQVDARATA
jgi:methyl-accepting chemotaxis protein